MMPPNNNSQQATGMAKDQISPTNDVELRAWADRLNVTKVQLKAAINAVGSSAKIVETYLYRRQQSRR